MPRWDPLCLDLKHGGDESVVSEARMEIAIDGGVCLDLCGIVSDSQGIGCAYGLGVTGGYPDTAIR